MTGSLFDQWRNSTIGTPVSGFTGGNVKGAKYDKPGFSVACCCSIKTLYIYNYMYIYIYVLQGIAYSSELTEDATGTVCARMIFQCLCNSSTLK